VKRKLNDRISLLRVVTSFFIRKRIDGTLKAIEDIITNIESTGFIPGHLIDIVDGGLLEIQQMMVSQLLINSLQHLVGRMQTSSIKEANREQLEIAERIEHYNAVLVQGPPGTGKTHTIANLLGHFLAQGKMFGHKPY
jgi:Cdc6-like AAA superfamily ATPase